MMWGWKRKKKEKKRSVLGDKSTIKTRANKRTAMINANKVMQLPLF